MGKKKDRKQKGKGAEKTALKTEVNEEKKSRKRIKEQEDDVENLIAEFQERAKKRIKTEEERCAPPSPRSNLTMTAHPYKDELVFFGGEYFNGSQTFMYNDLLLYNLKSNEWSVINSPRQPAPRCGHQAVAVKYSGGQLWVFGGEFASPSQSQFYHYSDLWVFSFTEKSWQKVNATGGPSSRSGHRMTVCKRQLILFGGYHDNTKDFKYFNDVFSFNMDSYQWTRIEPVGIPPLPRSACVLASSQDQSQIIIYGGYSKERVKKYVDKGKIHRDMYCLSLQGQSKDDESPTEWKWQHMKQYGTKPSPRCGCTLVVTPANRALIFGGVFDEKEDEDDLKGSFLNDMYSLELDTGKWHQVLLRGKKERRDKTKQKRNNKDSMDMDNNDIDCELDEEVENLCVSETDHSMDTKQQEIMAASTSQSSESSILISTQLEQGCDSIDSDSGSSSNVTQTVAGRDRQFWPSPRMNALMAVKNGVLYLFGGMFEVGNKQLTLRDMYSLDLHKLDGWNTIIESDVQKIEYEDSDSSVESDDDSDSLEGAEGGEESSSDDDDEDMELGDVPQVRKGESAKAYFSRSKDYWLAKADEAATEENRDVNWKQLKKAAFKLAEEHMS